MPRTVNKAKASVITARVPMAVRHQLSRLAKKEGITRTEYAARVLVKHIEGPNDEMREMIIQVVKEVEARKLEAARVDGAPISYQAGVSGTAAQVVESIRRART